MFGSKKNNNSLYKEIKRSFVLQMITVSLLGLLISRQDYRFKESVLQVMIHHGHKAFLNFMELVIGKIPNSVSSNYWACAMQALVASKSGNQKHSLESSLKKNNERVVKHFKQMVDTIPQLE